MKIAKKSVLIAFIAVLIISLSGALAVFFGNTATVPASAEEAVMDGWTESEGTYTPKLDINTTSTLTFTVDGERYIFFDLSYCYPGQPAILGFNFYVKVDGTEIYSVGSDKSEDVKNLSEVLHVKESGSHSVQFIVKIKSKSPTKPASALLSNIQFKTPEQTAMQNVAVHWEENFGDVMIIEGGVGTAKYDFTSKGRTLEEKTLSLPVGMTVSFFAEAKTEIKSSIVSDNTHAVFAGYFGKASKLSETQNITLKIGEGLSEDNPLEIRFLEYVPEPQIKYKANNWGKLAK